MALLKELEKYHAMSPKDVMKEETQWTTIDVAKNTVHTGEQFHIQCPVYKSDTREELNDRLQFFLSIMQDRLEQENAAMVAANQEQQMKNLTKEAMRRNENLHKQKRKEILQLAKSNKWSAEEVDTKLKDLELNFQKAQHQLMDGTASEELMASLHNPKNLEGLAKQAEQVQ